MVIAQYKLNYLLADYVTFSGGLIFCCRSLENTNPYFIQADSYKYFALRHNDSKQQINIL